MLSRRCAASQHQHCLQVAFYLIDLLQDSNAEVVKAADQALTVINDTDEEWASKLRALKFEAHNQAWLEACATTSIHQVLCHNFLSYLSLHSSLSIACPLNP